MHSLDDLVRTLQSALGAGRKVLAAGSASRAAGGASLKDESLDGDGLLPPHPLSGGDKKDQLVIAAISEAGLAHGAELRSSSLRVEMLAAIESVQASDGKGRPVLGLRIAPCRPRRGAQRLHKVLIEVSGDDCADIMVLIDGKPLRAPGKGGNAEER